MGTTKKNVRIRKASKKLMKSNTVIVIKTTVPAEETLFPEKLKKANALLEKTKLMD